MPATQNQVFEPPALEQGFTRRDAPELFKFEKRGDRVEGTLVNVSQVEIVSDDNRKQRVTQYLIARRDQPPVKILATWDLLQKLTEADRGLLVRITFLGEDHKIKRGDNYMKIFDVQTKETETPTNAHGVTPTDEDVPF